MERNTAIIRGTEYRFTVLTSRLIRMEYSKKGEFVDCSTQVVMKRDFQVPAFRIEETGKEIQIITDCLRLKYDKKEFSPTGLQVKVNGQYGAYSAIWNYGDEPNDLKGTARTLDGADGSIPLESGILSADGWSLLDDSTTLLLDEKGWIGQRRDEEAKDIYFFGYGRDYLKCLEDFHHLTGNVPLLPRYALGNWWSRYYRYSEESYLELMDRFQKENLPFTVAVIDMDWHITDVEPKYGTGWTGYTWNRDLFPDPERFMKNLHDRNMKVTLNVHPADGVRAFEDCYTEFAEYMGVATQQEDPVSFNVGDPKFMKGYFEYVHHPLEELGVDFWWIDWQQGSNSGVKDLDPLWMLNHYHYLDNCRNGNRGLIFSRYAGPGSHRYPVGFSGDTIISWDSLQFQPYFTANASNIGYGWWSHDIGGHMRGVKDDELAVRWLQFGVFSPIMRLHSSCSEFNGKEPWRYNMIAEKIMKDFLRLRHKMIPYVYTMNLRANRESIPLLQPMYYHYPHHYEAYTVPNEYYFGSEMVVCPVTVPTDNESGMAKCSAWLPEGKWIDLFTGMIYEGGRTLDLYRGLDKIPVLVKCGGIVVLDGRGEGNNIDNPDFLEIYLCAGDAEGGFALWEDNGNAAEFREEDWADTKMKYIPGETAEFQVNAVCGNSEVLPDARKYRLVVMGTDRGIVPKVYAAQTEVKEVSCSYDEEKGATIIGLPYIAVNKDIVVKLTNMQMHQNQKKNRVFQFLNRAEMSFDLKNSIYDIVQQADHGKNMVYIISQLQRMGLREEILGPVMEVLASCEE
ncbi:MAG: glycoside hydrolase family 31 protein [Lachnospiraceae bacterium]|nr:glycoside hydrolase family 31 protein [Lachnospiraceae bacterium]